MEISVFSKNMRLRMLECMSVINLYQFGNKRTRKRLLHF